MKKLLAITFLLLGYQIYAIGQNWDLFPKGQYSMFELTFSNQSTLIERLVKDSTIVTNDSTMHYFNSKIINESGCQMKITRKDVSQDYAHTYLQLDSCGEKNNWQYFNCRDFSGRIQFRFNTKAKVNETWTVSNNLAFTCDSASQLMVFGQLDSVKYFSNSKAAIPFVLSKTFGLIEFADFSNLIRANVIEIIRIKLIGYEKQGMKKGYTVPDFSDFFHLKAGDVVYWHYYEEYYSPPLDYPMPPTDYYYKDSITNAILTADSVIYEITSIRGKGIINDKQSFYRDKFSKFLNANATAGIFTIENPMGRNTYNFQYWQCPRMEREDTIFSMDLLWGSLLIHQDICRLGRLMDAGEYFTFDTRFGLSAYNFATAVGSIINGEKWGITKIPTGISKIDDPTFRVFPNPCIDKIVVQLKSEERLAFKLFNSNGQLVKAGQLTNPTIDVADLPDGLYNLLIGNDKMQKSKMIVKVNKY